MNTFFGGARNFFFFLLIFMGFISSGCDEIGNLADNVAEFSRRTKIFLAASPICYKLANRGLGNLTSEEIENISNFRELIPELVEFNNMKAFHDTFQAEKNRLTGELLKEKKLHRAAKENNQSLKNTIEKSEEEILKLKNEYHEYEDAFIKMLEM